MGDTLNGNPSGSEYISFPMRCQAFVWARDSKFALYPTKSGASIDRIETFLKYRMSRTNLVDSQSDARLYVTNDSIGMHTFSPPSTVDRTCAGHPLATQRQWRTSGSRLHAGDRHGHAGGTTKDEERTRPNRLVSLGCIHSASKHTKRKSQ